MIVRIERLMSDDEARNVMRWIADNLGPSTPIRLSSSHEPNPPTARYGLSQTANNYFGSVESKWHFSFDIPDPEEAVLVKLKLS